MTRVALGLLACCATAAAASPATGAGFSLQLHRGAAPLPPHGHRHRRMQTLDGEREVVPLKPGLGTHFAWVYAGTPPQRASVIADTGSSLMAFPCSGCDGCGTHTDAPFVVTNSSSLAHVTCKAAPALFRCRECGEDPSTSTCSISQAYMEGSSWEATIVEDVVYLGGEDSAGDERLRDMFGTHFKFGCQRKETGLFITQVADGIMGLANNGDNIVAKLHREKKIPANLFSLCFADGGGSMAIGAPNTAQHRGEVAYAKLAKDTMRTDFYNVHLRDIRVDNVSIEAPASSFAHGHFIVDSGTTDSYLPTSMKSSFEAAFKRATGLEYQPSGAGCTGYNDEQLAALPNIQLVLEAENGTDLVLQVPPDQYLIQEKGHYCANVFLTEFSGGVIGANIMQDRDVIFDPDNHRVGFVDADCTYVEEGEQSKQPVTSKPPRDHPAPGVVASSEPWKSNTSSTAPESTAPVSSSAAPVATSAAPTVAPTVAPTPVPTPSFTPEPKTTAPTSQPAASPSPTSARPTSAPTSAPTATSTVDGKVTLDTEKTEAPTTTAPTGGSANTNAGHKDHEEVDEHPMVLTVVGTVLVVVFLLVVAASIKINRNKKDHNWSRVKENEEEEEEEDEDGGDEELGTRSSRKGSHGKQLRSDDVGSDDDDDDEDEIFDRTSHDHEGTKHDTRMLERL